MVKLHGVEPKANYGFDGSPSGVAFICFAGLVFLGGGTAVFTFPSLALRIAACSLLLFGSFLIFVSCSYLYYTTLGKLQRRDAMISMINWKGTEKVLDIGTGRGLLMIGAAKKLTTGKSIGIDIWNSGDMHGNAFENTMRNAELEDVLEKVELKSEDARNMSFPDETFDVILSNLCLHNIPTVEGQEKACREIARVLKPSGTVIIADKSHTKKYGEIFAIEGLSVERSLASFDGSIREIVVAVKK